MKKSRFTENQILGILKEYEAGMSSTELARKYQISKFTIYTWKQKYTGMVASDMKRLKELEDENAKLKKMYANLSLENHALKDLIEKKL